MHPSHPFLNSHILFYSNGLPMYDCLSCILQIFNSMNSTKLTLHTYIPPRNHTFCFIVGIMVLLSGTVFLDIKVNNDLKSPISNLIEFTLFRSYSPLKPHILFYSKPNGLAIWHGLSNIRQINFNNGQ